MKTSRRLYQADIGKGVGIRAMYNKTKIWHWLYLDYIGTDDAIRDALKDAVLVEEQVLKALDVGCGPKQVQ